MVILSIVQNLGASVLSALRSVGRGALFFWDVLRLVFSRPFYAKQCWARLIEMGFLSLPLIALTALFTGMVLALQSYGSFARFGAEQSVPEVVALSIARELGPVLSGLMIAGRMGASIAAELGTMRVTEQIDALWMLSTNPVRYLIVPRLLSGVIVLPLLTLISDVIGIFGGLLVCLFKFSFPVPLYTSQVLHALCLKDITAGLIKAAFFGGIIAFVGCYQGFCASRGAKGVGQATTRSVVLSSILILFTNYVLTAFLFE